MRRALILALPLLFVACKPLTETSHALGENVKAAYNDERTFWSDVFVYHPPKPPQSPQTRYCYKLQADVVCYDSLQPTQTAKLFGYQDGDQISWVQPGGGSLGASGGEASSPRRNLGVQSVPGATISAATLGSIIVHDTPKISSSTTKRDTSVGVVIVPNPTIQGAAAPVAQEASVATTNVTSAH